MVWLVILAAWGALCLLWVVSGLFLPRTPMTLICRCPEGTHPDGAISRHRWLCGTGLCSGPLLILGRIPAEEQRVWKKLYCNVEFMEPEHLPLPAELERMI
jgi:hypothetical protein